MTIKIFIVDDHPVFRGGLKNILETDNLFEVIGEASSGEEALEKILLNQPDLLIMDINMPGIDGIETTKKIKNMIPDLKILMLTMYTDEAYLKASLQVGASGYVIKRAVDTELITAIKTIIRGEHYIYPTLIPEMYKTFLDNNKPTEENIINTLSQREQEVLKLLALGYTQKEIAEEIFISIKTVDSYKTRVMDKLGTKKRSELVKIALQHGLLELEK